MFIWHTQMRECSYHAFWIVYHKLHLSCAKETCGACNHVWVWYRSGTNFCRASSRQSERSVWSCSVWGEQSQWEVLDSIPYSFRQKLISLWDTSFFAGVTSRGGEFGCGGAKPPQQPRCQIKDRRPTCLLGNQTCWIVPTHRVKQIRDIDRGWC